MVFEDSNVGKFKVKKCLKCGAETHLTDNEEKFCSKCGAPILNRCSDYSCYKILDEKAKFCKHCGSASTFNNYGLLDISPLPSKDNLPF
jgi:RNA polymerase subunit RPABC4/transcription elongation factor Spt4